MERKLFENLLQRSHAEPFGRLLEFDAIEVKQGFAVVRMRIRPELENIFGATHGGAVFSLIDEAFQLASNSHGILSVALNVSITYTAAPSSGKVLQARAEEVHKTRRTASYYCDVREIEDGKLIATAQALAIRTGREIDIA
ncbi:MAG: PaaI family thioesterase [Desulfomonilaceae bacterium]|nr:PaaI family thioesterase [Desulfomonilaceae bacterium]